MNNGLEGGGIGNEGKGGEMVLSGSFRNKRLF